MASRPKPDDSHLRWSNSELSKTLSPPSSPPRTFFRPINHQLIQFAHSPHPQARARSGWLKISRGLCVFLSARNGSHMGCAREEGALGEKSTERGRSRDFIGTSAIASVWPDPWRRISLTTTGCPTKRLRCDCKIVSRISTLR